MNFKVYFFHLWNSLLCKYVDAQTSLLKMILEEKDLVYIFLIKPNKQNKNQVFLLAQHYSVLYSNLSSQLSALIKIIWQL